MTRVTTLGAMRVTMISKLGATLGGQRVTITEDGTSAEAKVFAMATSSTPIRPIDLVTDAYGTITVYAPLGRSYSFAVYAPNSRELLGTQPGVKPGNFVDSFEGTGQPLPANSSRDLTVLDNDQVLTANGNVTYTIQPGAGAAGLNIVSLWLIDTGTITLQAGAGVSLNGTVAGAFNLGTVHTAMAVQRTGVDSYSVVGGTLAG